MTFLLIMYIENLTGLTSQMLNWLVIIINTESCWGDIYHWQQFIKYTIPCCLYITVYCTMLCVCVLCTIPCCVYMYCILYHAVCVCVLYTIPCCVCVYCVLYHAVCVLLCTVPCCVCVTVYCTMLCVHVLCTVPCCLYVYCVL